MEASNKKQLSRSKDNQNIRKTRVNDLDRNRGNKDLEVIIQA
jgi:hypothetical protein